MAEEDQSAFFIVSEADPSLVLDINGSSQREGEALTVYHFRGGANQLFQFDYSGMIVACHSDLVLDVDGGVRPGNPIIQYSGNETENQLWFLHSDGSIRLDDSDLCITISGAVEPLAPCVALPYAGKAAQKWRLTNYIPQSEENRNRDRQRRSRRRG